MMERSPLGRPTAFRVLDHVRHALERARNAGCTHLLPCDDDELLYMPSGLTELEREEQRCPRGAVELHARTVEALCRRADERRAELPPTPA